MNVLDRTLLFPYWLTLKLRQRKYRGGRHSRCAEVPTICLGNVTVGGTGKTPHTELVLRTLIRDLGFQGNVAVLSRGYKRRSKGFQQVVTDGSAAFYGDEPLQIKRKFPGVTVALEKDRLTGCKYLRHPDFVKVLPRNRGCRYKDFAAADVIVLDDAFQYRRLQPSLSIVLVDSSRPVFEDKLLPLGRLRDLPERIWEADMIIVTKCPTYLTDMDKEQWAEDLGLREYSLSDCAALTPGGRSVKLLFSTIGYCEPEPIFPEGDRRYTYGGRTVLFSGIADDLKFRQYLSGTYQIQDRMSFPDHHKFTRADIASIGSMAAKYPTALVATTEKDAQRIPDVKDIPLSLKEKLFYVPIEVLFLSDEETAVWQDTLRKVVFPAM